MSKFLLPFKEGSRQSSVFSPAAMLTAAVAAGVVITVQVSPLIVASLIVLMIIAGTLAHTRWRVVFSLAARFEFVILFWILLEPFLYGSTVIMSIPTPLGPLNVYSEGVVMGLLLGLRMFALLILFLTVLSHMTLSDFINALRTLHVPTVIIGSLMIMLRYIPLFLEERSRMQEAQFLRGFQQGTRWSRIKSLGYLVGSTIDRAFDRSIVVYDAMALRGFGLGNPHRVRDIRIIDSLLVLVLVGLLIAVNSVLPPLLDVIVSWSMQLV